MIAMRKAHRIPLLCSGIAVASISIAAIADVLPSRVAAAASSQPAEDPRMVQDWRAARDRVVAQSASDGAIASTIAEWRRLQQSDALSFSDYANFLVANPGWPGEDRMRRLAERAINPDSFSPSQVVAFFRRLPPDSATGQARFAMALAASGDRSEAGRAARAAWTSGTLSLDDERRILGQFAGELTPQDHATHADLALWARDPGAAERVLAFVPADRRPVLAARISFQRQGADSAYLATAAEPAGLSDAGYLADKSRWMFDRGDWTGSRQILASRAALTGPVGNVEKWYETLLRTARAAANDRQWSMAYAIASRVDDAYPQGTDISDKSLGVRDDYTSLTWLAGTTALHQMGRPADAMGMFERYAKGARSPQTRSKGYYWAGRAATAAGQTAKADDYFRLASAFPDQFYGQLALERKGVPMPQPGSTAPSVALSDGDRQQFNASGTVRAARYLGATGQWMEQSRMLRAIAANADDDADRALAVDLARELARPDLSVMVGRHALRSGDSDYRAAAYPQVPVPSEHRLNWTMIHAIARQESQFDRQIVSHAGARGLMQLMPGTARETAGKIGLSYNLSALYQPDYNIQLGSTYFQRMLSYYGGSYPLAVAAYNAGPGNVNKWLKANGDPRLPGADILRWIEEIPIYETKNYVQRVLENAVIYDTVNPNHGGVRIAAPLSRYLGKSSPG